MLEFFLSEKFRFLEVILFIYLNRRVFVMFTLSASSFPFDVLERNVYGICTIPDLCLHISMYFHERNPNEIF